VILVLAATAADQREETAVTERSEVQKAQSAFATKWRFGHWCARRVH
jgi:hypothetical protein